MDIIGLMIVTLCSIGAVLAAIANICRTYDQSKIDGSECNYIQLKILEMLQNHFPSLISEITFDKPIKVKQFNDILRIIQHKDLYLSDEQFQEKLSIIKKLINL